MLALRNYNAPRKKIGDVPVARGELRYIERSIDRLAILQDVRVLTTPDEIRIALSRWYAGWNRPAIEFFHTVPIILNSTKYVPKYNQSSNIGTRGRERTKVRGQKWL